MIDRSKTSQALAKAIAYKQCAVGYKFDRDRMGARLMGGGMDMGFELVYNLGYALWPKGVRKDYAGRPNKDGGYAFHHEWF